MKKMFALLRQPLGKQEIVFLTEYGLYKLLGRSIKLIAHKFQKMDGFSFEFIFN
jgi:prophage antirepressor-like protein